MSIADLCRLCFLCHLLKLVVSFIVSLFMLNLENTFIPLPLLLLDQRMTTENESAVRTKVTGCFSR